MLKMKIGPAICMKTKDRGTKCTCIEWIFLSKNAPFARNPGKFRTISKENTVIGAFRCQM
jgi:hypothetical protein